LQRYRSTIKKGEERGCSVDLRNDEVDGHFFPRGRKNRRLGRWLEEILARVLEVLEHCCHQRGGFEDVE